MTHDGMKRKIGKTFIRLSSQRFSPVVRFWPLQLSCLRFNLLCPFTLLFLYPFRTFTFLFNSFTRLFIWNWRCLCFRFDLYVSHLSRLLTLSSPQLLLVSCRTKAFSKTLLPSLPVRSDLKLISVNAFISSLHLVLCLHWRLQFLDCYSVNL